MKRVILKYTFLLAIIILSIGVRAQTTQGTDVWVSFGSNFFGTNEVDLQIRIVALKATNVVYTFTNGNTTHSMNMAAGEVKTIVLTNEQKALVYSNSTATDISDRSLYIHSDESVSVYALNQYAATTDATNVLPVNSLGTEYYHISYIPHYYNSVCADGYMIVATEDGTDIFENGSTTPVNTSPLSRGQVYTYYSSCQDMTGTRITSNHPISLFTTDPQVFVPVGVGTSDNLFQQMVPVGAWGKNYMIPVTHRGAERVRIVASQDNTTITQMGGTVKTGSLSNLNKGQFVELEINLAAGGCYISADKPIGVCSFMMGILNSSLSYFGDPSIAWVPPVEQFVNSATIAPFIPTGATNLNDHHALIVTATANRDQTTLSIGNATPTALSGGTWTTGANPAYSFYNLPLTLTDKSYTFANPNGLAVLGYGFGYAESYYYLAASALKDLTATFFVNGKEYFEVENPFCRTNFSIKAVIEAASTVAGHLKWFIDDVERTTVTDQLEWLLPYTELADGDHKIRMEVIDLSGEIHKYETTIIITCVTTPKFSSIPVNPR
jgi:hypothetical protein